MPQAPETYRSPKANADDVEQFKSREQEQRGGNGLYQSYKYIKFRERQKKAQRAKDDARVHDIYQELEHRSFQDYMRWMQGDNPLCVHCLDEGKIKPGRVLDHITPIEKGGSVWNKDNHAWLCDHHHNVKRATEDRNK